MPSNLFNRRVATKVRVVAGNRTSNFYTGGDMTLESLICSNGHATATTLVEVQDKRRNIKDGSFYVSVPPMGSVVYEVPFWFPAGFSVLTGNSAKVSVFFSDGSDGRK